MLPSSAPICERAEFLALWNQLWDVGFTSPDDLGRLLLRVDTTVDLRDLESDVASRGGTALWIGYTWAFLREAKRRERAALRRDRVADRVCLWLELDRLLVHMPDHLRHIAVDVLPLRFVGRSAHLRIASLAGDSPCLLHAVRHGVDGNRWKLGQLADDYCAGLPFRELVLRYTETDRRRSIDGRGSGLPQVDDVFERLVMDVPSATVGAGDVTTLRNWNDLAGSQAQWL